MRKVVSLFKLTLLTVGLLVGVAGTASATLVNLFHSPANDGTFTTDPLAIGAGAFTLNLWATPSVFVLAMNPMNFSAIGGMTVTSCTAATNATCGPLNNSQQISWAEIVNGSPAGTPIKIATVGINSLGTGTFSLLSGGGTTVIGGSSTDLTIDPNSILVSAVIPEPGTLLLLGAGLTGLVLQGSRRREN